MANEFIVKNGLVVGGNVVTSGTITINGALAATQSWVTSQAYLTSASLSGYATQSYVTSAISALVDAAPAALDTLNELAAALGDDANFSTTVTNSIASKLPLAGGTMTGQILFQTSALNNGFRWDVNSDAAGITFKNTGDGDANSYFNFFTEDNGNEYFKFSHNTWNIGSFDFMDVKNGVVRTNGNIYVNASQSGSRSSGTNELINGNRVWHDGDFSSSNISNWNTAYSWGNHATAGYLTSVSDIWVNTAGDTMTGALTIQGGWATTILDGDNVVLRKPNYSAGGWARTLLNFQEYNGTSLFQIGGYGSNNTMTYGYLGSDYSTPTFRWYADKTVMFDGSVGIGTTGPEAKLHIVSGSGQAGFLSRGTNGDTWFPYSNGQNYVRGVTNFDLGSAYFTGGNVGIGTSSPTGTYGKLTVAGGIHITNDNNAKLEIGRYSVGVPNSYIKLGASSNSLRFTNNADSADLMELTNSGNLGLGVTPSAWSLGTTLQIGSNYGTINYSGTAAILGIVNAYYNGSSYLRQNTGTAFSLEYNIASGNSLVWRMGTNDTAGTTTSLTPVMALFNNGNLLITNSTLSDAGYKLDVNGTGRFSGQVTVGSDLFLSLSTASIVFNSAANFNTQIYQTGGSLVLYTGANPRLTIASTGAATFSANVNVNTYLSLGTGSGKFLAVGGAVTAGSSADLLMYNTGGDLILWTTGAVGMIVKGTSGNVGIGTTAPSSNLHVLNSAVGGTYYGQLIVEQNGEAAINLKGVSYSSVYFGDAANPVESGIVYDHGTNTLEFRRSGNVNALTLAPTGAATFSSSVTATSLMLSTTLSNELLMIGGTGSRGIGVSTTTSGDPYVRLYDNTTIKADMWWGRGGSGYMGINSLGAGSITAINPFGGNVGIGTTSPGVKLDVNGDGRFSGGLFYLGNYSGNPEITLQATGNSWSKINFYDNNSTEGIYIRTDGESYGGTMTFGARWDDDESKIVFKMYQTSAGASYDQRVGIGTTSPASSLHVYTDADVWHTRIGGASGELRIGGQTPSGAVIQAYTPGGSVRQLYLQRDGGNVGIGNDNPTATLQINGAGGDSAPTLRLISAASDTFNWASDTRYANLTAGETSIHLIGKANSQYNQAYFGYRHVADGSASNMLTLGLYASDYLLNILGNGNVGIGTTSPARKLHVVGTEWDNDTGGGVIFGNSSSVGASLTLQPLASNVTNGTKGWAMYAGAPGAAIGDGNLGFWAHGTNEPRLTIKRDGNVGIGTTSPANKLVVTSDASPTSENSYAIAAASASDPAYKTIIGYDYSNDIGLIAAVRTGIGWRNLSIPQGSLGIGTYSPSVKLHVVGNAWINRPTNKVDNASCTELPSRVEFNNAFTAGSTGYTVFTYPTASVFRIYGDYDGNIGGLQPDLQLGLGYLTVKNSGGTMGNVGIGTTSPATKLDVNGVITATGGNSTNWNTAFGWGNHASAGYLTSYSETDTLQSVTNRGGTTTNRLEFQYSVDRYSQAWRNTSTGAYWWVTTDSDKLGLHLNGDGDKFYFSNTGDFYSVTNGWLSSALAAKQNASTAINTSNIGSQSVSYANSAGYAGYVNNQAGQLLRYDNRTISPSETNAGYLQFGFTSWNNNGGSPYADYLHMRSYDDGSGGNDNLVMFLKSGIGMRIYQQTFGSATAYSSYADVWTTANFTSTNVSNWNTAYGWGNHASYSYATTSYVTTQINNLIAGAPGALDTLSELATALGNDASFATTVTNSIAGKVSKSGDTMTSSGQQVLNIFHGAATGDFNDALFVKNTVSEQQVQIGMATTGSDGDHHRVSLRAYKGAQALEGVFGIALRQPGSAAHTQRLTLDYLGNLTIGGFLTESSSLKLKENIKTSEGNLEKVVNLRPVTYNKIGSQTAELGLIAEEVAEVYPEFVQYDENGEPIGVNYSRLTAALIGAVKELTNQVQELNKKING